ncbi:MAG: PHP domain-containing protein, partial [Spirochaetota bacterium]
CEIVHAAGGLAIVAHPQTLRMSWPDLEKSLKRWKGEGLDGVEAYHANLTCNDAHRIAALAGETGLIATAGSDFHGLPRTDRRLGRSCDGVEIDDAFLEPIGVYDAGRD